MTDAKVTRVFVVAASAPMRAELEAIVASSSSLELMGSAEQLETALLQLAELAPEVVLWEVESVADRHPELADFREETADRIALVVLADNLSSDLLDLAFGETLVAAALPKAATGPQIVAAITAAAAGLVAIHPLVASALFAGVKAAQAAELTPESEPLTRREIEVLQILAEGLANKAIATRLGISEHTVKFHIGSILGKMGVSTRAGAVALGIRRGLVMV